MLTVRRIALSSLILSSTAFASETRVATLQGIEGIQDESDIFTYAGAASRYSLALLELGNAANDRAWATAVAPVNSTWHMGTAVNRHNWQSSYYNSNSSLFMQNRFMDAATSNSSSTADDRKFAKGDRSFDVFGAMSLSAERSFGFRLSTAKERSKSTTTSPASGAERSSDSLELALGYSIVSPSIIDIGLAIGITDRYKYQSSSAGSTDGIDLKSSLQKLDARWIANPQGSGYYAQGTLVNRSGKATATASNVSKSGKFSDQVLNLGGGYAYTKSESASKFFAGLNLYKTSSKGPTASGSGNSFATSISTSTETVKVDAQWLDASLSGEGKFYENIGAMFGTNYTFFGSYTEDDKITKTKTEEDITAPTDANLWSLGLFWATESARVDATISKTFLHNGPHFIAGNETSPMLGRIAATYNF